jgi:hypothetical protein
MVRVGLAHQPKKKLTGYFGLLPSVGSFIASAAGGGRLLHFGTVWPLVLTSFVFSLAIIPLMFGEKRP